MYVVTFTDENERNLNKKNHTHNYEYDTMKKLYLLTLVLGMGLTITAQERYLEIYKDGQVTHAISLADISQMQIGTVLHNNHDYVDLALPSGTLWATCNVGALTPEGAGAFYAWGETATKTSYTTDNLSTYGKTIADYSGNPTYDVATKLWGGMWRTPTHTEMQELVNNCTWVENTVNGVAGYTVTSTTNGKSIFLPAAGYTKTTADVQEANITGRYWTSTPYDGSDTNKANAYYLSFETGNSITPDTYYNRYCGRSVRAVMRGNKATEQTFAIMSVDVAADSKTEYVMLADIADITFPANKQMQIAFNNGTAAYTYEASQLGAIAFQASSGDEGPATEIEQVSEAGVRVYQDGEVLTVESSAMVESIRIYNVQGQLLCYVVPASQSVSLSIADVPVGVLCIQLTTSERTETYKIIKQ